MTIPVGTLCMLVDCECVQCGTDMAGKMCTVTGHQTRVVDWVAVPLHVVTVPGHNCDGTAIGYVHRRHLRPIAPPGDPDRVTTPEREPVEVIR